ncbi:unnamed protein product [Dracunculus medinensis]|uniref:Uncharacterized protein n=1 Tax=Dracunculus medinensis TaxID=318479 RepID=A0A3P7SXC5_DRAME|nr:unnamed protein product [Dracunculus medinensis]
MISLAIKLTECSIIKRQTFIYDEDLKKYARPHRLTKIHHGTLGRYAPHDWPSWYTRTIFKWNGEVRNGPYFPTDVRYNDYQIKRAKSSRFV